MIQFNTISLKAQEIFDSETGMPNPEFICSPLDILVRKTHSMTFHEGDSATIRLTDGSCFEVLFEKDGWMCSHFNSSCKKNGADRKVTGSSRQGSDSGQKGSGFRRKGSELTGGYWKGLEEAIIDIMSKKEHLAA